MKELAREEKEEASFIETVRESLRYATDNQERIDVLARAKKYADDQWLYWASVRRYVNSQLQIVEIEAQLKLPLIDSL